MNDFGLTPSPAAQPWRAGMPKKEMKMRNLLRRMFGKTIIPSKPLNADERAKAIEYEQVAALVCHDLDLLLEISERGSIVDIDALRRQIRHTHDLKEKTIRDAKARERRYGSVCLIYSAAAAGLVRNDIVA